MKLSQTTMDAILRDWFTTFHPEEIRDITYIDSNDKQVYYTVRIYTGEFGSEVSSQRRIVELDELRKFIYLSI